METYTIGPFIASLTTMGPMKGILIPKKFAEEVKFLDLYKLKKHKITIKIEKAPED